MRKLIQIALLVVATSAIAMSPPTALGQTHRPAESSQTDDKQILRELLDEVRQLRLVLQRTHIVSQRLQVSLERLRLQQGRVDSLTRALERVRSHIADTKAARTELDVQIKEAEELLSRTTEANLRTELEPQVKLMKDRLGSLGRQEEQLREREGQAVGELQGEQAKLNELHIQLENMVRELEVQ